LRNRIIQEVVSEPLSRWAESYQVLELVGADRVIDWCGEICVGMIEFKVFYFQCVILVWALDSIANQSFEHLTDKNLAKNREKAEDVGSPRVGYIVEWRRLLSQMSTLRLLRWKMKWSCSRRCDYNEPTNNKVTNGKCFSISHILREPVWGYFQSSSNSRLTSLLFISTSSNYLCPSWILACLLAGLIVPKCGNLRARSETLPPILSSWNFGQKTFCHSHTYKHQYSYVWMWFWATLQGISTHKHTHKH